MPQLVLAFHLRCASGYLASLSFYGLTHLHIFYVVFGGLVLYHFSMLLLVGDTMFGFFFFFVCFAMLITLCCIISVMFLFRLSMSPSSYSAVNLFFLVRVETCSSSFQSFECQLLLVYSCLGASSFTRWCLE